MNPGTRIDYKTLRKINPEGARQAVVEYPLSNGLHWLLQQYPGALIPRLPNTLRLLETAAARYW
jgi:hypothetical protein